MSFLFGKDIAYKMSLLDQGLLAIERQHHEYFARLPPRHFSLDNTTRSVGLADLVQTRWQAGVPLLVIDPALPEPIAAACLACLQQVRAATWPRCKRRWWRWR